MTQLRVCFVGASVAHGTGDAGMLGWPGRLGLGERARGHDLTVYNLGVRGDTSTIVAGRWRAECAARLPDTVAGALVFSFGANDSAEEDGIGRRLPLEESLAAIAAILKEATHWRPTLWVGPPPIKAGVTVLKTAGVYRFDAERLASYNVAWARVAAEAGVPYLDMMAALRGDSRWPDLVAAGDGVHPPAEGYAIMADLVAAWPAWRAWLG